MLSKSLISLTVLCSLLAAGCSTTSTRTAGHHFVDPTKTVPWVTQNPLQTYMEKIPPACFPEMFNYGICKNKQN